MKMEPKRQVCVQRHQIDCQCDIACVCCRMPCCGGIAAEHRRLPLSVDISCPYSALQQTPPHAAAVVKWWTEGQMLHHVIDPSLHAKQAVSIKNIKIRTCLQTWIPVPSGILPKLSSLFVVPYISKKAHNGSEQSTCISVPALRPFLQYFSSPATAYHIHTHSHSSSLLKNVLCCCQLYFPLFL